MKPSTIIKIYSVIGLVIVLAAVSVLTHHEIKEIDLRTCTIRTRQTVLGLTLSQKNQPTWLTEYATPSPVHRWWLIDNRYTFDLNPAKINTHGGSLIADIHLGNQMLLTAEADPQVRQRFAIAFLNVINQAPEGSDGRYFISDWLSCFWDNLTWPPSDTPLTIESVQDTLEICNASS